MAGVNEGAPAPGEVERYEYVGRGPETEEAVEALATVSQAALRQLPLERLTGYGVDYADAVELRGRVFAGQDWQTAATELADLCLRHTEDPSLPPDAPTRVEHLFRASALLRLSQMMMLTDTPERRKTFAKAADTYAAAADLVGDRTRVLIESEVGPLAGWLYPASDAVGSAIVIGGVEGYAMDFSAMGKALAARNVDALLLDGPGQGETRFIHGHYLSAEWPQAYRAAIDFLDERAPGRPIGFIGNSMGGSFAMATAVADPRIKACCNNGGIPTPWLVPPSIGTFFEKMVAFCGVEDAEQAVAAWETVIPLADGPNRGYPLLTVHGEADPLVSDELAQAMFDIAPTDDKKMVVFSDGIHCIYNHERDRDVVITDWMRARLTGSK